MKLYLVETSEAALACAQLVKLSSECARLQWSRTITDVPEDVSDALSIIQEYVETKIKTLCGKSLFAELDEETEKYLFASFKNSPLLRQTVGSGVVMAGAQADAVRREIKKDHKLQVLADALSSGKSVVLL